MIGLLQDHSGAVSSKRVLAFITCLAAIVAGFTGYDTNLVNTFMLASAGFAGITGIEKFGKK